MSVVLVGSNPAARFSRDGQVTAFASLWQVDWSVHGSGPALVLWQAGRVRLIGPDPDLAGWLADTFVRHFGEVAGLPWEPTAEVADVHLTLSLTSGLRATAGPVTLELSGVLDRRVFSTDRLPLGGTTYGMSNVYAPCGSARLSVDGAAVPGDIAVDRDATPVSSTAFLAVAEVWTTPGS
jgi:hypothetical protein